MRIIHFLYHYRLHLFLLLLSLYTVGFILITLSRYSHYQVNYYDFGFFDTAIWKVAHFQLPIVDKGLNGQIIFADHFNPSLFLLSPLYWFTSSSQILLIAQVIIVALSALVAYFIADNKLHNKLAVFALLTAYLGYVGLQNALIFDIHDTTLSVLPLILVFWALLKQKWKLYFLFLIIFLGFKESNAGAVVGISLYLLIKYRKQYLKQSIATLILGLSWGILTTQYIIPAFNEGLYVYTARSYSHNLLDQVKLFFLPQVKTDTLIKSFATFGFLPLFNLALLPTIFEQFLERFVLSDSPNRWDLGLHYNATLSPLLFIGSLDVLLFLQRKRFANILISIIALGIIAWVVIFHRFIYHGPLGLAYNWAFYQQNPTTYVDNFVARFPKGGVVMTQNNLAVRLTHQSEVRLNRKLYYSVYPDYIILDLTPGQNANSFFPLNYEETVALKNILISHPDYRVEKVGSEQYIFTHKKPD